MRKRLHTQPNKWLFINGRVGRGVFRKKCDKFMKGLMARNIIYIFCFCLLLAAFLFGRWFGLCGLGFHFYLFFFFLHIFQGRLFGLGFGLFGLRFGLFRLGFNHHLFVLHFFQCSSFFRYGHNLLFKVIFIELVTVKLKYICTISIIPTYKNESDVKINYNLSI